MESTRPRLTDAEFFGEQIDTTRPGLEAIPAAVEAGDFATARHIFAAEVRASLQPERWFRQQRSFLDATHYLPDETAEAACVRVLAGTLVSCSTPCAFGGSVDWFANPTFNKYKEWTWQLSRHPEWALLGERYRATGDERLAAAFVKLFLSWKKQTAGEALDAPSNATWAWRTIEAGIRMGGAWPWALHSFYRSPYFDDDVLVEWYKSVWEHGWRLRNVHHSHNWLIMEQNGLGQIGILYPQFCQAEEWRDFAFATLIHELGVQNYPDGMQYELSTGYRQVNIRN
ncbi:MAG TPA: heparinase II/III family protein, partial [Caldilineaceae bacterium]|nr:heparinase II/III family protein [Caldilineaceae bacterium]